LLIVFGVAYAVAAHATPWFTQDPRTLPAGHWRVEEHVLYSGVEEGLADGRGVPLPNGATGASALTAQTRLRYGLRDDLTLFVDVPFVAKHVDTPAGALNNSGLGDLTLLGKWKYHEDKAEGKRRAMAGFAKLDTGEHEGQPGLLALGSGQNDLGLIHLWEWRSGSATWYGNLGYVFRDYSSDTGVNPGDWYLFNLAAEHPLGKSPAKFVWEVNGRHESRSHQGGRSLTNTGATIFSLSPGLQYVDKKPNGRSITWEAGVQVPLIKGGNLPAVPDYTAYAGGYAVF